MDYAGRGWQAEGSNMVVKHIHAARCHGYIWSNPRTCTVFTGVGTPILGDATCKGVREEVQLIACTWSNSSMLVKEVLREKMNVACC